ncbi:MAG TPA: hypothetical protein VFI02_14885 [Armatimonadota bacterium]|nr:hypothetical protein [Armatimonadota bacterium]
MKTVAGASPTVDVFGLLTQGDETESDVIIMFQKKTNKVMVQFQLGYRSAGEGPRTSSALSNETVETIMQDIMSLGHGQVATSYTASFHFDRPQFMSAIPLPIPTPGTLGAQGESKLGSVHIDGLSLGFSESPSGLENVRVYLAGDEGIHVDILVSAKQTWAGKLLVRSLKHCADIASTFVVRQETNDDNAA